MIKKVFLLSITALLLTSCSGKKNNIPEKEPSTYSVSQDEHQINLERIIASGEVDTTIESVVNKETDDNDTFLTLTGEIITDGNYSNNRGAIAFVPDEESKQLLTVTRRDGTPSDSYGIFYDDISKVKNLPDSLGIYKVNVVINNRRDISDIELTNEIGTVLYEGKEYETNVLDFDVRAKDRVCGLIVQYVDFSDDGIYIQFAGQVESEGYYHIYYNEMYGINTGNLYLDEEYYDDFPTFKGEENRTWIYFSEQSELFNNLVNQSAFGRGKFKTSAFWLLYNIGIGFGPNEVLDEIISLDDNYKGMFNFNDNSSVNIIDMNKDFVIIQLEEKEEQIGKVTNIEYYYISKKNPKKELVFSTNYYYELSEVISESEFILYTDGVNAVTNKRDKARRIRCLYDQQTGTWSIKQVEGFFE